MVLAVVVVEGIEGLLRLPRISVWSGFSFPNGIHLSIYLSLSSSRSLCFFSFLLAVEDVHLLSFILMCVNCLSLE